MKILITVDPEIPVPPKFYGGIERVVDKLCDEYANLGHEVALVAHPDSNNKSVKALYPWPNANSQGFKYIVQNTRFLTRVIGEYQPDVVHSFSRLLYLYPALLRRKIPMVQTYQRRITKWSSVIGSYLGGSKIYFTACGAHQLKNHPIAHKSQAVHNFTDVEYFTPSEQAAPYLMFLGRIEDLKGTYEAIQTALKTGHKLIIAGNIADSDGSYFQEKVEPFLDDESIKYVGPVDDKTKRSLLQSAKAFLFPIKWEEPFGIVMAEAMACGVPIIGFNRGSVPEVVDDGKTGFVVDDLEAMCKAVENLDQIDRKQVRESCVEKFSSSNIAKQYLSLFQARLTKQ